MTTKKKISKPAVKKASGKKASGKKAVAKKTVVKKAAAPKAAPKKKLVAKASAVKKPVAKKPVAKKTLVKKAPAKVAPKKAAPKKTIVKKPAPKKAAPKAQKEVQPKGPYGITEQLRDAALKILDERQGEDIVAVDLRGKSPVADYVLIATGRSGRQLAAIADYMRQAFFALGIRKITIEGVAQGDWVLIDAGDVVIHLFRPEVRRYYQIEDIWSAKSPKA